MDVSAVFKGKGGGKGKGKVTDKNFSQMLYHGVPKTRLEGMRNVCGKVGRKRDEWWLTDSKDVGKGNGTEGTGKKGGKGTPQFQWNCSRCGKLGQKKADSRSVGALGGGSPAASTLG